jgi:SpoVK/Ycf46/Vps4 family AAA+-type ATPase
MQLSGVVDSFMGATSAKIARALEVVGSTPAVWVLDEIDAVSGHRIASGKSAADREWSTVVNSLCIELDKLGQTPGLIVGATNRLDAIDPAILRRFDVVIEWPEPSEADLRNFALHVGGVVDGATGYADVFNRAQHDKRRRVLEELRRKAAE